MSGHTPWSEIKRKRKPKVAIHMGREAIEAFVPPVECLVISITDPGSAAAVIKSHPLIKAIYRVEPFHDIDPADGIVRMAHALESIDPASYKLYDAIRASALAIMIKRMENDGTMPPLIVAHCEAGIFRSSAIAAALQMYYRMDCPSAFKTGHPNRHVYRLTLNALNALKGPR